MSYTTVAVLGLLVGFGCGVLFMMILIYFDKKY